MTTTQQPEAINLEEFRTKVTRAAREPLLARIAELEAQLSAIGAGGVEPLRKPASQQAVQAAVSVAHRHEFTDGHRTLKQDVFSAIHDYATTKPEQDPDDPESWESWFEAAFDLLGTRVGQIFEEHAERSAPAHPAEGVPAQTETLLAELAEKTEAAENWRRLALQFDNHRMQALGHLKAVVNPGAVFDAYKAAKAFINAPPLGGEEVLTQRLAELAATSAAADMGIPMSESDAPAVLPEPAAWLATFRSEGMLSSHSVAGTNLEELKRSVPSGSKFKPLYAQPILTIVGMSPAVQGKAKRSEEMKKHDYTALDCEILKAIESGKRFHGDIACASQTQDAARLLYATKDYDGFVHVGRDKYDFILECMKEAGRSEPTDEDELNGVRRFIDAAISAETKQGEVQQ